MLQWGKGGQIFVLILENRKETPFNRGSMGTGLPALQGPSFLSRLQVGAGTGGVVMALRGACLDHMAAEPRLEVRLPDCQQSII